MLLTHQPTESELNTFLLEQSRLNVKYSGIEMTRLGENHSEPGYRKHFVQETLGSGETIFANAVQQMNEWHHFRMNWILLYPNKPPIAPNTTLVVAANHTVLWSMNACRIVYTIDETTDQRRRFGYAYGTLPSHVEQGEESFVLQWDRASNLVTYQILAYSKANHPLVAAFWPIAVLIQDHFRKQSLALLSAALKVN